MESNSPNLVVAERCGLIGFVARQQLAHYRQALIKKLGVSLSFSECQPLFDALPDSVSSALREKWPLLSDHSTALHLFVSERITFNDFGDVPFDQLADHRLAELHVEKWRTLSNRAQSVAANALDEAANLIHKTSPEYYDFVSSLTASICIESHAQINSGSYSRRSQPGRTHIVVDDSGELHLADMVSALVHEAVHHYLYMLEFLHPLYMWRNPSDFEEARVTSPWTGVTLPLSSFCHALVVWHVLNRFWSLVDTTQAGNNFSAEACEGRLIRQQSTHGLQQSTRDQQFSSVILSSAPPGFQALYEELVHAYG